MTEFEAQQEKARAERQYIRDRITPNVDRYAGAVLAGALAPGIGSVLDDQDENLLNSLLSGSLTLGGFTAGSVLGMRSGSFKDETARNDYVRSAVSEIKKEAEIIRAKEGPLAAADYFGRAKETLMHDIDPISQAKVDELKAKGMPWENSIYNMSPRQANGTIRGAALGTLAAALPAYFAMRGGEIE